ncbi:MAG: type IV pilus biogenesis protein PilP [Alphaproteobacteria bacterium]|nr:type IV pilus biogenesis protein PilP [Alphaproteobacteria bacterium]
MKIASKYTRFAAASVVVPAMAGLAFLVLAATTPIAAQDTAEAIDGGPVLPDFTLPPPEIDEPALPSPETVQAPVVAPVAAPDKPASPKKKAASGGALPNLSTEPVHDVLEKLSSDPESDATIEDMNQARAALARLELMVDIEQKLSDLDEVRRKRGEGGMGAMIPSSALGMPGNGGDMGGIGMGMPMQQQQPVFTSYEVSRIVGTEGTYSAVVNVGNGRMISVRPGDQLPDGSTVRAITSGGVNITSAKGKEKTIRVNSVGLPATVMQGHR